MKRQVLIFILPFLIFAEKASGQCTLKSGTADQDVCINIGITDIVYTLTGSTGASVSPLPTGVSYSFATPDVTISGTPLVSGTFSYTVTMEGGGGCTATGTITVDPLPGAAGDITGSSTVCQGATGVGYSVAAIADAISYEWVYSGTGATINGTTNSVTINFTTNATSGELTVRGVNTCGNGTVSPVYAITVDPLPGAAGSITGTSPVCQGETGVGYSIAAITDAVSYQWTYSGTGATINGTTNSVTIDFATNASSGNLTVRGVNACGNGIVSPAYAITVNPLPGSAGSITGTSPVCQGETGVSYNVSAITDADSYEWVYSGTGATINGTTNSITIDFVTGATSGNLTVRGVNTCGNGIVSPAYAITVRSEPGAAGSITGTSPVCQGETGVSYNVSAITDADSYEWVYSGTGATINGTTNSVTINFTTNATSGELTVRGVNTCGNGTVSPVYAITVDPLPGAAGSITGTSPVCQGETGVGYSIAAITDAVSYQWTYSGTGATINGTTNSVTIDFATNASSGNLTVRGVNACGNGIVSPAYAITVNPLPGSAGSITGTSSVCEGVTGVNYSVAAITDAVSYQWTYSGTGVTINGTTNSITIDFVTGATSGNLTVRGVNTCGNGIVSPAYAITVNPLPQGSLSANGPFCASGSGQLTWSATAGTGPYTIIYKENGSTNRTRTGVVSGTPFATYTSTVTTTTTYTIVSVSDETTTCMRSSSFTDGDAEIIVNPLPTLSGASQDADVCSGFPARINLTGLLPGTKSTIYYSIAGVAKTPVTNVDTDTDPSFLTESLNSGDNGKVLTITGVRITDPATMCYQTFSESLILIVNTANTPSLTGNFSPCVNSTGNDYETDGSMSGYTWVVSAGGLVTDGGGASDNFVEVTWNSVVSQSVSVNYTNSNGCTSASPTAKTVDVKPLPAPAISGILPVCIHSGGHVYTTEEDMTLYSWSVSAGNTITSGGTGNMIIVTWDNATAPSVSVNYTDANGCRALAPTTNPVTVNSLPVPDLSGASSACAGSTGNVYSTDAGMSNYVWTITSGGTVTSGGGSANNSVTVSWNTPGAQKVSVNYTVPASGCTASAATELPVTVNPLPVPTISGPASPNVNTSGNVYTTEALMTGYNWNVSAGGTINSGTGTNSISVTWNSSGAQTVSLNYTNSNLCTAVSPTVYNVTVNALPVASGITIHGTARSGLTLNASYTYTDADGDAQGTSLYQWYTGTSSAGAGANAIASANTTSYILTDAELTYYIGFSVTPVALSGSTPGNTATTITWTGPVINDTPVATIQPITGSLNVNGLLTGHYIYSDVEGDIESGTSNQWYSSSDNGVTFLIIPGETSISHVITNSEQGYYFKIVITPGAASGSTPGDPEESVVVGPANSQPVAGNVQIVSGTATVGSTLTGDYDFSDADPADLEGTSTFRWLRNGTVPIPGATATTYLVTPADEGYTLAFEVTPVSSTGYPTTGTPVQSTQTLPVVDTSPLTPVASQVCVEGIRAAGQILRGKYYYDFYKSEGISTYQWYRNGVAIPGATEITYTLMQVEDIDSNADITFRVTPRSSNVPEKVGTTVASNPLSRIIIPKDYYSVSESDVTLSANVSGGVFSGTGVTGNIFSPSTAGSDGSPHTLSYQYIEPYPAHNCSQQASRLVYVNPNVSSFLGFDPLYCHDSGTDVITVTGVPTGSTIVGFSLTDAAGIVSQAGTTVTIDPGRMRPGVDEDILFFSYYDGGIFYQISKSFKIDSVGTDIRILNLDQEYCQSDPKEYISIEGMYPVGGTAVWTGDILSDTRTGSAYADPSLGVPNTSYPVSYQYRSPLGCFSAILRDTVTINKLPDPSFALNPTYNIDGGSADLIPVQTGGSFSGNGVSGAKMFPDIAGLGEHEIKYSITDANGCSAELGKKTTIRKAQGSFAGIPAVICYSDTTYRVNVNGLPVGVTVNEFTNTKNTLAYTMGFTYADYNVPAAGEGLDTLRFSYKWDGVDYDISTALNVDSLGHPEIKNLTTSDLICDNMTPYELFPSITGGTFTGPVIGSYLDPTKGLGPAVVKYTFTNTETGCSVSTSIPVTIYPAPKIAFEPADYCIEDENDTTYFNNNTIPSDIVEFWSWTDADGKKFSTDEEPGYHYKSGGLQKITLTATTLDGCSASKELTFNLGVRPDADFYWKNDCMHPGDYLILRDTTKNSTPLESRSWRLFNGAEFSTAEKEASYPKDSLGIGYSTFQYIVRTTIENCIDTVTKDIYIKPSIIVPDEGYYEDFKTGNGSWIKGETSGTSWSFGQPDWADMNIPSSVGISWYTDFSTDSDSIAESSSIVSPCFDFSVSDRPLIKLNMMKRLTRDRDGASLQYRIGSKKDWQTIGAIDDGINWYNSAVIRGEPGGSQMGWTLRGEPDDTLIKSIHTLDEIKGQSDVVFRIAYGFDGTSRDFQGIILDDIWIGERSRNVLIEHFTNTEKTECSDANSYVDEIVNKRIGDVIGIQYHTNFDGSDPYYNDNPGDASARVLFYGLTQAPYTFVDGGIQSDFAYMYSYANAASRIDSIDVTNRGLIPALFNIELVTDTISDDLSVSGKIKALEDIDADNLALFLAVTEKENSEHTGPANENVYYNVFRKFIPDAGGITLKNKWAKLDEQTIGNHVWTMENIPDYSDIEVIAFIQNTITKEVYQASSFNYRNIRVGIEDAESAAGRSFRLYPNPTVNNLTILFEEPLSTEADIMIIDVRGEIVRQYTAGRGITEFFIDNPGLKGGIYFVRVSTKGIDLGYQKLVVSGD